MYKILANTIFLGKHVVFLPECHSTNDKALELIRSGHASQGSIVVCANQTHGKGQRGNVWESEPDQNLTFSLILKPDFLDISEQFYLNMVVSNAIRNLLQEYLPDLKVKWPNDLVVPGKGKIGGILIENILSSRNWEMAVIGIGLNINQRRFSNPKATSLAAITGGHFDLQELFRLLIVHIEQGYIALKKGKTSEIIRDYLHHLFLKDQWTWYRDSAVEFEGKISGVSREGKLQVDLRDGGVRTFDLKEISFPET
ncbi:biotin--[acetyl-CoA-carboxylase] ligase [Algoriphagus jejuensis]|uniref:Biotin--[acetyl-CoA-carboxylase] ligase n=1 Tax=Algoriphagus jejuensis TaxID=419934 RepID=A0ABP3YDW5_9BACT